MGVSSFHQRESQGLNSVSHPAGLYDLLLSCVCVCYEEKVQLVESYTLITFVEMIFSVHEKNLELLSNIC